jgi:hypothetical protein
MRIIIAKLQVVASDGAVHTEPCSRYYAASTHSCVAGAAVHAELLAAQCITRYDV